MLAAKYGIIEKSFPWFIKVFSLAVFLDIINIILQLKLPISLLYGIILVFSLKEYKIVKRLYFLHFIPFLSFLILWLIICIIPFKNNHFIEPWLFFDGILSSVYIFYAFFYLYLAKLYLSEKDVEERNVIFHIRNQIIFITILSIGKLLKLFHFTIINFNLDALQCAINIFTIVFMTIYFLTIRNKESIIVPHDTLSHKKSNPNVTQEAFLQYEKIIDDFFSSSQEYIKPNFSITILSERTGIPKHHLSSFFNHYLEQNFNEYLAKHRIEYAIEMMANNHSLINMKIETIAFECGYNSTTTFNKWFKLFKNCLPNEFIRELRLAQKNNNHTL